MSWYYITGGLILWVADHAIRLLRSLNTTVQVQFMESTIAEDVIIIGYTVSDQAWLMAGNE